jgi:AhpD family alkylhydroperoxidase
MVIPIEVEICDMQPRMDNPAVLVPDAMNSLLALNKAVDDGEVPARTLALIHLRVSQINGCAACVDQHPRFMKRAGETDERLFALSVWRDAPYFTDAERAALALAEAVTRIADRNEPVPDAIWDDARQHYAGTAMAKLLLSIASINVWNRLNVATRQRAGLRWG